MNHMHMETEVAALPPGWSLLRLLLAQARPRRTWVRSHGWGPGHIRTPPLVTSLIYLGYMISLESTEDILHSSCKLSIAHNPDWHTLKDHSWVRCPFTTTAIGRCWQIHHRNARNDRAWRISRRMLGNPEVVSHWDDPGGPTLWLCQNSHL